MLHRTFAGKRLVAVHVLGGRYVKHGKPVNFELVESPDDVYFVEVKAKGKLIYMNLSNEKTILSTLGLMGKWTRAKTKHCGLAVEYSAAKTSADGDGSRMMYFKDQIHYGTFSVIDTAELPKKLNTLGIDVNDREEFTWDAFKVRAKRNGKNTLPAE
jgi:formamidopyrimidine-DNA glycosylase